MFLFALDDNPSVEGLFDTTGSFNSLPFKSLPIPPCTKAKIGSISVSCTQGFKPDREAVTFGATVKNAGVCVCSMSTHDMCSCVYNQTVSAPFVRRVTAQERELKRAAVRGRPRQPEPL